MTYSGAQFVRTVKCIGVTYCYLFSLLQGDKFHFRCHLMPDQSVLEFVQDQLDGGKTNSEILVSWMEERHLNVSKRTLQRWIKENNLERRQPTSTFERSLIWIDHVRSMINMDTKLEDILYVLQQNYNEDIYQL